MTLCAYVASKTSKQISGLTPFQPQGWSVRLRGNGKDKEVWQRFGLFAMRIASHILWNVGAASAVIGIALR